MGKHNKSRDCPAVGRVIKGDECGSNRGTNYRCPPDCPHCPWTVANYDQMLEIERRLEKKTLDFLAETIGGAELVRRMGFDVDAEADEEDEDGRELRIQGNVYRELFLEEHRPGMKLFDLWREAGWKGLRNDEVFLAGFMAQSHAAVLEVRRVLDGLRSECIDLLDEREEPFVICDRGLAASAGQYQTFICWLLPGPFFHRLQGIAWPLALSHEPGRDVVRRHAEQLGAPPWGDASFTAWLGRNITALREALHEEERGRFSAMLRATDVKQCVATYRFEGIAEDLGLTGREDFDEVPPDAADVEKRGPHRLFVWLRAGASKPWESRLPAALQGGTGLPGTPIWGQMRLFPGRIELSAMTGMHFGAMKDMAEEFFGDRLELEREFVADLARQAAEEKGPAGDVRPSSGLTVSTSLAPEGVDLTALGKQVMDGHYTNFLENPVPALDGLTPREAAKRPDMRKRLVSLMKGHLQSVDTMARGKGSAPYDLGWVLEELGLTELVAAPRRPASPPGPAAPLTPRKNWWREISMKELMACLDESPPSGSHADDVLDAMPELVDYLNDAAAPFENDHAQRALFLLVALVLRCVVPPGVQPEPVGYDAMQMEARILTRQLEAAESIETFLPAMLDASPQPAVLRLAFSFMVKASTEDFGPASELFRQIEPEDGIMLVLELEALLRCLRRSALG